MKLTNPNRQKLQVRRAILWSNVYHSMSESMNADRTASPKNRTDYSTRMADEALKAFDERFPDEVAIEAKKDYVDRLKENLANLSSTPKPWSSKKQVTEG